MSDIAETYVAATERCDLDVLGELMAPEVVVWHNHDGVEVGRAEALRTLSWLHRSVADLRWEASRVVPTGVGFVWQSMLTGSARGGPLRLHSCVVVTLSDTGLIVRVEEYLDSASLAVLAS